jgi:hypothetical protein
MALSPTKGDESLTSSRYPEMFATWKYRSATRQAHRPWVAVSMTTWLLISLSWRKKMLSAVVDDVMNSASVVKLGDT